MNAAVEAKPKRATRVIVVAPAGSTAVVTDDLITLDLAVAVLGLTRKAMEGKIFRGDWLEGRQYHRDPSGAIWISRKGVRDWVMS